MSSFKFILVVSFISLTSFCLYAQDMKPLVLKVKAKLDQVKDYVADGKMKTDIAFIKAPVGRVQVFFKQPNKFKLKRASGISILPRGGVTINMNTLVNSNEFVALAAGDVVINGVSTKIVKLLPTNENSDVILTTLYIDEANLLILKAQTTTKENGSFEMQMQYGKYANLGLPEKVIFSFNTSDYKIPKGVALEFEDAEKPTEKQKLKNKKGKVEITYSTYTINKGIEDAIFH